MLNGMREQVPASEAHLCGWCEELATVAVGTDDQACEVDWTRWFGGGLAGDLA